MTVDKKFWSEGLQFQCQGSGHCCVSRGDYGYVYLTKKDRVRMAEHLKMKPAAFTKKYCDQLEGIWKLKSTENCLFLEGKRCSIYEARPTQCRTWPFWPEVLNAKTWNKEVSSFCAGVGKGKIWTAAEIEQQLRDQIQNENEYGT